MIEAGSVRVEEFVDLYSELALWDVNSPRPELGDPHMGHVLEGEESVSCVYMQSQYYPHIGLAYKPKTSSLVDMVDVWLTPMLDPAGTVVEQYVLVKARRFVPLLSAAIVYKDGMAWNTPVVGDLACERIALTPERARTRFNLVVNTARLIMAQRVWPPSGVH